MSEKLKHTPGPWAWQKFGEFNLLTAQHGMREIIIGSVKKEKSFISYPAMNDHGILQPIDENHPNAKLIAAAPELLEALQNLVFTTEKLWNEFKPIKDSDIMNVTHPIIEDAKEAIKKATE